MSRGRILHITTFLQGGAGRIVVDLALAQHRAGYDVGIVAARTGVPGYQHYPSHLAQLDRHGIATVLVDSTFSREPASTLAAVAAIDAVYAANREPTVIHAHAGVPSVVALLFAGARRRPLAIVQTMHGWGVQKTPLQAAADVAAMNLVDRVVVPSRHAAGLLTTMGVGSDRIDVVPYGVGQSSDRPEDAALDDLVDLIHLNRARRAGAFVVVCVGTIGERKNQHLLVQAMAQVPPHLRIHCVFVGDGDADGLRSAVAAAAIGDRVEVLGYRPNARRFAAQADALVLPSRSEGQPIAILEAFQDGALVIASDIPELAELVEHGQTGLTFASDSAEALAATLELAATMPNALRRRLRTRAHAAHREHFSTDVMARRYEEIYAGVLGATSGLFLPRESPAA